MRISARVLTLVLSFFFLIGLLSPSFASAQTTPAGANLYTLPNAEPNVPNNQHTRVQSIIIDLMSATFCILTGIDPVDKNKACVDVNPQTGKLTYSPPALDQDGKPQIGGLLGTSTKLVGAMYTPTIGTGEFVHYYAQNFGIVKPAYAQTSGYGFSGLSILLPLWISIRNMAYFLLMVAFIAIGLGIMLRVKVDPRTIMSLQNQIPRIIICILLVTFSYGIAGLMIDAMWLTTYVGINVITSSGGVGSSTTNPIIPGNPALTADNPNKNQAPLSQRATENLLQTPVGFVNQVFRTVDTTGRTGNIDSGIGHIAEEVSYSLGSVFKELFDEGIIDTTCSEGNTLGVAIAKAVPCLVAFVVSGIIKWVAAFFFWILFIIIILRTLFSVWFTLLKAYTYVILYTIGAPFFIVMGLLPGKPLGFEKWLRSMFANLAVFPITAFIFVLARLFIDIFAKESYSSNNQFVPPLIGQPNIMGFLGVLIALGLLLMTPTILAQLQEALKVPGNKYGGAAIGGLIAAGAAAPKAASKAILKRGWQRETDHQDAGILRRWGLGQAPVAQDKVGEKDMPGRFGNTVRKIRYSAFGGKKEKGR